MGDSQKTGSHKKDKANRQPDKKTRTFLERQSSGDDEVFVNIGMSELRATINESVDTTIREALADLKNEILDSVTAKLTALEAQLDIISGENDLMRRENTDLKKRMKENEDRLSEITKNENSNLASWKETMRWCNENEQYGRRWCLRIHGHQVQENEDVKKEVVVIIHQKLQLKSINEKDIEASHRIGRARDDKPPAIIVRFHNRDIKQRVIRARRELKGSKYVITEDLTTLNQQLLNRARFHDGVNSAWSWNGHVWCMTKAGLKIKLRVYDDLNVVLANAHQQRGRDYQRPPPPQLKQRHFGASPERPPQPVRPTVNNNTAQSNNTSTPDTAAVTAVAGNDIIN